MKKYFRTEKITEDELITATAKSEAYKEFAERLIEKSWETGTVHGIVQVVEVGQINNLLKEMVGENK